MCRLRLDNEFWYEQEQQQAFSYFNCTSYRQHGPKHSDCTSHYIRYDTLYAYVLGRLQYWSAQADVGVEHLKGQLFQANDR